jgi:hypothetical protein
VVAGPASLAFCNRSRAACAMWISVQKFASVLRLC